MKSNMKIKQILPVAFALAMLILDSRTAIEGAKIGLETSLQTVLPSLFPFLFLSSLLTSSLLSGNLKHNRFICRLYRIPIGAESILLTGLLGGYPVGAKCISEAVSNGQLSNDDGKRMLTFCNAAGPAFLFGMTGSIFSQRWVPWCLWGLHLFSSFCIARLLPAKPGLFFPKQNHSSTTLTQRLRQTVLLMGEICGWVTLMRIIISFAEKWLLRFLPAYWRIFVVGILELSNGCVILPEIENLGLRFILCCIFLSFGGLCVVLQTKSAASMVDQRMYIPGKLIQALISFLTAYLVQYFLFDRAQRIILPWLFISALVGFICILVHCIAKQKKSCGILERVGV